MRASRHSRNVNPNLMPPECPKPDLSLYKLWCAGDTKAGNALFCRFAGALQRFFRTKVRPEDIEDLVQQVWVGLSESRRRGAAVHTTVRAYVFGVARHVLCRYIRSKYRQEAVDVDLLSSSIAALEPSLSTALGEQMAAQRMVLAMQRLPLDTQILLEFRYVDGLSTAELASLYDVPVGTIKSRLAHARAALESEVQRPG